MAKVEPENAGWQRDLSLSYSKVGDVLMAQGNLAEAQKSYQDSLAVADRLAKVDPENADLQRDLAMSQGRLAIVLAKKGDAPHALNMFRQGRAITSEVAKQSPDNGQLSKDLAAFDDSIAKLEHASVPEIGSVKPVQVAPPLPNKKPPLATADVRLQGGI